MPQSTYTVVEEPELIVNPRLGPCAVKVILAVRARVGRGSTGSVLVTVLLDCEAISCFSSAAPASAAAASVLLTAASELLVKRSLPDTASEACVLKNITPTDISMTVIRPKTETRINCLCFLVFIIIFLFSVSNRHDNTMKKCCINCETVYKYYKDFQRICQQNYEN